MMQSNVLLLLPARWRQAVYVLFGLIALGVGAAQVGYASIEVRSLAFLDVAVAVVGFLAIPFSAIAASNVAKDAPPRVIEAEIGTDDSDQPDTLSVGHRVPHVLPPDLREAEPLD